MATGGSRSALIAGLVIVGLAAAGLIIYFGLRATSPRATPIGEILADLRRYDGQIVTVEGMASAPLNLMVLKSYEVTDETGSIMVVTERGLPQDGSEVAVEGVVHEVFNLGGINYTVILEPADANS